MKNTKLPSRVLSGVLACALTFSMTPSAAFAADAIASGDDAAAVEQAADDQAAEDLPSIHAEEVPVTAAAKQPAQEQPSEQTQPSATQAAPEDAEIINSSVSLDEQPATILSYNGMNFRIDQDATYTAALVGISSTNGDTLVVPSQIQTSTGTLTVTEIVARGGVRAIFSI